MLATIYQILIALTRHSFFLCLGVLATGAAQANGTLTIGELIVERNSAVSGHIAVASGEDGVSTSIPVTVFNGAKDGPVLGLVAGVHGSEYSPILAMQRLVKMLDTNTLSGAVIVVHNANLPAFQARTIYFGPNDLKNLNRLFPGTEDGSITERIAFALTENVIKKSDYLVDIHSGDANESLGPSYSAYYAEAGSPGLRKQSQQMAVAFGLDTIVQFGGDLASSASQIYTSAQAVALGIPAIDIESGELGVVSDDFINPITDGVMSLMRHLELIPGEAKPAVSPVFIKDRARVYSKHDGVWHLAPRIHAGQYVHEGTLLGHITNYHGKHLAEVKAPASGILLIVFGTPPVNKGDNMAVIGLVGPKENNED
ncbi:MAG: succinylglutamate desuccinylase/aspartoacylase family protein [Gammaproteobacteria bacterium]